MSLSWKIFLGTAVVIAAVLGATIAVTDRAANKASMVALDDALAATRAQVEAVLDARRSSLQGGAASFVQNPGFVSSLSQKKTENAFDQATEAVTIIGADWVQLTDEFGVRLARSDSASAPADTLTRSALISGALEGDAVNGIIESRGGLAQAVSVPVREGGIGRIVGSLMAVRKVDSAFAQRIVRQTGGNVQLVFFTLDENLVPQVSVTTVGDAVALTQLLQSREWKPDSAGRLGHVELPVGAERYVGQGGVLVSASGTPFGGFLALRSADAALAPFRELRTTLLATGGAAMVLAFFLSFVGARTVTRPVKSLAGAARRAAEGDYLTELPAAGKDEIGTLTTAFRALLADLREKQELVDLLQADEARRTVQVDAMSGTLKMAALQPGVLAPGARFARRYEVKEVLGAGGMGTVYKAVDAELGEVVAIKTLKADFAQQDETALERFRSEIRLARKISHRNVVRTHDIGESDGTYYITMEYVEGRSLKDLIRQRGALKASAVITIGKQLCRALEVAHEAGVIHRDIKPQNIVLGPDGVLKVMDFGIARLAKRTEGVTQAGMVVGTPEYMAPEQFLGDDVDLRADVYSAGAVLYECLTGRLPFTADSPIVLITKVLDEAIVPPSQIVPGVPPHLESSVLLALSRNRDERPASAEALYNLLVEAEEEDRAMLAATGTPVRGSAVIEAGRV
jgi:serine/threonine-protein kinase